MFVINSQNTTQCFYQLVVKAFQNIGRELTWVGVPHLVVVKY